MTEPTHPPGRRRPVRVYRPAEAPRPHVPEARHDPGVGPRTGAPAEHRGFAGAVQRPARMSIGAAVVAALLAAVIGAASVLGQASSYRSQAVVEIRRPDLFLDVNPGTISVLNALRSKYAALIRTEPIVVPAAEAAGETPEAVRQRVGAAITSDSLLFYPFAVAGSPERAERIAQAITESLVDYAEAEQVDATVPVEDRIALRIVQEASPGGETGPSGRRATLVGLVAGAFGAVVAFAAVEFGWVRRRRPPVTAPSVGGGDGAASA